jgi:hypothetical protein
MPAFLAGLAALLILVIGARLLARVDPQKLAGLLRLLAGLFLLALAAFLLARGALPLAIPLALFGFALLGIPMGSWFGGSGGFGSSRKSPGQKSHVRTDFLDMELDHDTGYMQGHCLKGRYAGRPLSTLSEKELLQLLEELRGSDEQGVLLLEAYLDRIAPDWREREGERAKKGEARARPGSRMSRDEAFEVLGLEPGASEEEIRAAHRKLMMKVHPDQGGSDYLAARINEAKDVLLGKK